MQTLECPKCHDDAMPIRRNGTYGFYFRCKQCAEVFVLVGTVLVSAVPPEFDLAGAERDRNLYKRLSNIVFEPTKNARIRWRLLGRKAC